MTYRQLADFIANRMIMRNVYQPVAIQLMLESEDGTATAERMSRTFQAVLDTSEEFRDIRRYPGDVLVGHGIAERLSDGVTYRLVGHEVLSEPERRQLGELCESRLANFLASDPSSQRGQTRGEGIVYVLMNRGMPGLMKLGFTTRTADARAADFDRVSGTWLPFSFDVVYESPRLANAFQVEQSILRDFDEARIPGKEFLQVSVLPRVLERIQRDGRPV